MTDELWTSAKHIAQADGKKDDWVHVIDIYKSMGGNSMTLMIYNEGKRLEVLGEVGAESIIVSNTVGDLELVAKSVYMKARKKFYKKDVTEATPIKKSLQVNGKTRYETIYKGAKYV